MYLKMDAAVAQWRWHSAAEHEFAVATFKWGINAKMFVQVDLGDC